MVHLKNTPNDSKLRPTSQSLKQNKKTHYLVNYLKNFIQNQFSSASTVSQVINEMGSTA